MFTYKNDKDVTSSAQRVFDKGHKKLITTYAIVSALLIIVIFLPVRSDYLPLIRGGGQLTLSDSLYDYVVPLATALLLFWVLFHDYKNNVYELLTFYTNRRWNVMLFRRVMTYVVPMTIGSFVTGLIYFRNVSFLDVDHVLLSLRYVPNVLFVSALLLAVTVYAKNSYAGLFVVLTYVATDFLSGSRLFSIVSLGANANNFYYAISPEYYMLNRVTLFCASVGLFYVACKRSTRL